MAADITPIRGGRQPPESPPTGESRPTVYINGGELPEMCDLAEQALVDGGYDIFRQGGRLVTIATDGPDTRIHRDIGAPRVVQVTPVMLRDVATRAIIWQRFDARDKDWRVVDCPMSVAATICERVSTRFRELVAYTECPTLRPDGSPVLASGYDDQTGLYLLQAGAAALKCSPVDPTPEDARWDLETLRSAVDSFPYLTPDDHDAMVAGMMTAVHARAVAAAPMIAITATTPGTGKSYAADCMAVTATGRPGAVLSLGPDAAEADKRLASAMLGGDSLIHLDNVERPLGGDMLCQVITQPAISTRPLGASNMVRLPCRSVLIATGNNLVIKGDLTRRVLLIRLDAKTERPETIFHPRDTLGDIRSHRSRLIRAVLQIGIAYRLAGSPMPTHPGYAPLAGFGAWEQLVRRPLLWLGARDPLAPSEALREDDPDRSAMRALFGAIRATYGSEAVTAAQIAEDATRASPRYDGGGRDHDNPDLHDAIEQIAGGKPNARALGYALRRYRGRMVDGYVLEAAGPTGRAKVQGWRVRSVTGD